MRSDPPEMVDHLRFVTCETCGWEVFDNQPHPLDPERSREILRFQDAYWRLQAHGPETISAQLMVMRAPRYRACARFVIEAVDRIEGPVSILDIGASSGPVLELIARRRPEVLSRLSYVAIEPSPAFTAALQRVAHALCIDSEIIEKPIGEAAEDPRLFRPFDICIALDVFCCVDAAAVKMFLDRHARRWASMVMRDYMGLAKEDPIAMYVMYNPTFPLFAHNWRRLLPDYGFRITETAPSNNGRNDGYSWQAMKVERDD